MEDGAGAMTLGRPVVWPFSARAAGSGGSASRRTVYPQPVGDRSGRRSSTHRLEVADPAGPARRRGRRGAAVGRPVPGRALRPARPTGSARPCSRRARSAAGVQHVGDARRGHLPVGRDRRHLVRRRTGTTATAATTTHEHVRSIPLRPAPPLLDRRLRRRPSSGSIVVSGPPRASRAEVYLGRRHAAHDRAAGRRRGQRAAARRPAGRVARPRSSTRAGTSSPRPRSEAGQ